MSKLLAVAARELRERWLLFPGALLAGLAPFVFPAFGMKQELTPVVALVGAVLFGAAAAVVIGSSMLARDSVNGRLGFLFSRPVSWLQVWGGKWLAALVLVAACGFLVALPAMVAYPPDTHGGSWLAAMADARGTVFFLSLLFLGIGFANFNATVFRSRSPWLAVDFALLLVAGWAARRYVAPLLFLGVLDAGHGLTAYVGLAPVAVALLLGSAAQVVFGRTDLRRAHLTLSVAFWAVIGAGLLAAALVLHWTLAARPVDLRGSLARSDSAGRWVLVEGSSGRGALHRPGVLIDTTTGDFLSPAREDVSQPWAARGIAFSGDGRRTVRWRAGWSDQAATVEWLDLQARPIRATWVVLESSPPLTWSTRVVLSPSGGWLLLVHESGASLFAADGRRVATATLPPNIRAEAARFLDEDRARVWLGPDPSLRRRADAAGIVVTLGSDGSATTSRFALAPGTGGADASARTLLVPADEGRSVLSLDGALRLRDGATGAQQATLDEDHPQGRVLGLADGGIVFVTADGPRVLMRTFDREGRPLGSFSLPQSVHGLADVFELPSGRVALAFGAIYRTAEVVVIDAADGRVVSVLTDLRPNTWFGLPADEPGAVKGVPPARFFWGSEGRLVRVDFATGEQKTVLGPGAPRGERLSVR